MPCTSKKALRYEETFEDRIIIVEKLYVQYSEAIYKRCYRALRNHDDAKDAMHETFLKACVFDHHFSVANHLSYVWLIRIANNVCCNMLRSKTRCTLPLTDAMVGNSIFENGNQDNLLSLRSNFRRALNTLSTTEAGIINSYYLSDETQKEIANKSSCSLKTVQRTLAKFYNSVRNQQFN